MPRGGEPKRFNPVYAETGIIRQNSTSIKTADAPTPCIDLQVICSMGINYGRAMSPFQLWGMISIILVILVSRMMETTNIIWAYHVKG